MKIAVVGTGYVGLVTGVVMAHLGNDVICVDNDPDKLAKLRNGIPPIYEPGIEEMLKKGLEDGFLTISDSIEDATRKSEMVFIAVGTPPGEDGAPDLRAVRAVAAGIAKGIDKYTVVVNKSTVPVGSGDLVANILKENGADESLFDVVSNPEFLREGTAIRDTLEPDRIVIGTKKNEAAQKLIELYAPLDKPVFVTDLNSAELIKYASNSFLAMKISYINAISRLCESCGADVGDVAKGMGADNRIGNQFLNAGLGWGGSCLPKDVQGLIKTADRFGYDFELLKAVNEINDSQSVHFLKRIEDRLCGLKGKTIGLLGLAFKPNTDDMRDARSLIIIEHALKQGAKVQAYDPVAMENTKHFFPDITYTESPYDVAEKADALILVTEWNEFKQLDLSRMAKRMTGKLLFDARRAYTASLAAKAGLEYHTIGIASPQ